MPETRPPLRLPMSAVQKDGRTLERIVFNYETEKRLAGILRSASKEDRTHLYTELYDEYSRQCPDRSILLKSETADQGFQAVEKEFNAMRSFIKPGMTFLELGPGAGYLTKKVSEIAARCLAVDVSTEVARTTEFENNVEYLISDGSSVPAEPDSVDLAYSNQLMEHLHPDDAEDQLVEILRSLKPGGKYLCITPNRLTGPHDISKFFDEVATCFHLREYGLEELTTLMRRAGFKDVRRAVISRGLYLGIWPIAPFILYERLVEFLARGRGPLIRRLILRNLLTRAILQVAVIGEK
jgi:ubiquinone/menaquinone biosynthesis C-methylase UbiE